MSNQVLILREDGANIKSRSVNFNMIWIKVSWHGQSWSSGQCLLECGKSGLTGIVSNKIPFNRGQCIEQVGKLSEILNKATIEVEEAKEATEVFL